MLDTVLARKYPLDINTGTDESPVWTPIAGITGITPGQSAQRTDDADFDTDGWEAHTVVMRGKSFSVAINYKEDPESGAQDPGQAAVIALADTMGTGSKKGFRYRSPQGHGYQFKASADAAAPGGDKVSNANFSVELTMSGPPTPLNGAAAPVFAAIEPDTGDDAGGYPALITGTGFAGATGVTIGGAAATDVVVVDDETIYVTVPAGTAGAVAVAVTTPAGTDTEAAAFTYTA